jgi:hypothetical protein
MSLSLPVNRSVQVTAAKTYVVTVALCNTNVSSSFVGEALPLFSSSYYVKGFKTASDSVTSTITFSPGQQLQYVASQKVASTASSTLYPVYSYRQKTTLSCARSGTAVSVIIPFGTTYSSTNPDETSLSRTPSKYAYYVNYGSTSGPLVVSGQIDINIRATATTVSSFSVCSVSVT